MPRLGDFMTEGTISKWTKSPGDAVAQGEVVAEIETEKVNYDLQATSSGIFHPLVDEGAVVAVDAVAAYLLAEGESPPEAAAPSTGSGRTEQGGLPGVPVRAAKTPAPPRVDGSAVRSTPGARRLAAKLGVDLSQVTATGPGGRVVEADVRAIADQPAGRALPPGVPEPSDVTPLTGIRKSIADHMRGSIASTAQLSFFVEVDVTELQQLRKKASSQSDGTIGMAHALTKACADTLGRHPQLNTVLSQGRILRFSQVDIGVATALSEGLIVPVIRGADKKTALEIARETDDLSARAKDGKLMPNEVVGGTFTISVLGTVDGFTPILSSGQSAILGVGRSVEKPVVRKGEVVVREMMTLSLTVDHQVIDGAVAAAFLRRLQQAVERPAALFK
jgi:pyruvate dehydrogenase E2 component (dihydrolipoamide acetyltransferase)